MSKVDGGLRKEFRKRLTPLGFTMTPVETGGTVEGVPDTFWAHVREQTSGWIEYKRTYGWTVEVSPLQVGWMTQHIRAGVRCRVAVRGAGVGSSNGLGDSLWLFDGVAAATLAAHGLRGPAEPLYRCYGQPRGWDWDEVARLLLF